MICNINIDADTNAVITHLYNVIIRHKDHLHPKALMQFHQDFPLIFLFFFILLNVSLSALKYRNGGLLEEGMNSGAWLDNRDSLRDPGTSLTCAPISDTPWTGEAGEGDFVHLFHTTNKEYPELICSEHPGVESRKTSLEKRTNPRGGARVSPV